jgi:alpha-tubulin suppressor-like RCC1 family protein
MIFLDKRNRVFSMGNNMHGKTGQDTSETVSEYPTMMQPFVADERLVEIICGPFHNLAVTHKCRVYSWGQGF